MKYLENANRAKVWNLSEITYDEVDTVALNVSYDLLSKLNDFSTKFYIEVSSRTVKEIEDYIIKCVGVTDGRMLNNIPYRENADLKDNILKIVKE